MLNTLNCHVKPRVFGRHVVHECREHRVVELAADDPDHVPPFGSGLGHLVEAQLTHGGLDAVAQCVGHAGPAVQDATRRRLADAGARCEFPERRA